MGAQSARWPGRDAPRRRRGVGRPDRSGPLAGTIWRRGRRRRLRGHGAVATRDRVFDPLASTAEIRRLLGRTQIEDSPRTGLSEGRHPVLRRHNASPRPGRISCGHRQPRQSVQGSRASASSSGSRAADSSWARRSRIESARDSCRCARSASCRRRRSRSATISSTAVTASRCTTTRSKSGQRVLIVDDLLATGGTARATVDLVKQLGGQVEGRGVPDRARRARTAGRSSKGKQLFAVLRY